MSTAFKLEHSPTLNTVIMVEETLKNMNKSAIKVSELKKILPKQVNHNTLLTILEYLEKSNKIYVGVKGIIWIQNDSPKLAKAIAEGRKMFSTRQEKILSKSKFVSTDTL